MNPIIEKILATDDLTTADFLNLAALPLKDITDLPDIPRRILLEKYTEHTTWFCTQLARDARKVRKMGQKFLREKKFYDYDDAPTETPTPRESTVTQPTAGGQVTTEPSLPDHLARDGITNWDILQEITGAAASPSHTMNQQLVQDMVTIDPNCGPSHQITMEDAVITNPFPLMDEPNLFLPNENESMQIDPQVAQMDLLSTIVPPPRASSSNGEKQKQRQPTTTNGLMENESRQERDLVPDLETELAGLLLLPQNPATPQRRGEKRKPTYRPMKLLKYASYLARPARPDQLNHVDKWPENKDGIPTFLREQLMQLTAEDLQPVVPHQPTDVIQEMETAEIVVQDVTGGVPEETTEAVLESVTAEVHVQEFENVTVAEKSVAIQEAGQKKEINREDVAIEIGSILAEETLHVPPAENQISLDLADITTNAPAPGLDNNLTTSVSLPPQPMEISIDLPLMSPIPTTMQVAENTVPVAGNANTSNRMAAGFTPQLRMRPTEYSTPLDHVNRPRVLNTTADVNEISLPFARDAQGQAEQTIPSIQISTASMLQLQSFLADNEQSASLTNSSEKIKFIKDSLSAVVENRSLLLSQILTSTESRLKVAWKLGLLTDFHGQLWKLETTNSGKLIGISALK